MNLHLSEEQELLRNTVGRMFAELSTGDRVRAAEPVGFDPDLWKQIHDLELDALRVPESVGGAGAGLFEAVLVAEQAGRYLVSAPILEAMIANALLARFPAGAAMLESALNAAGIVSFVPRVADGTNILVPSGAVAAAAIVMHAGALCLVPAPARPEHIPNLAASPLARWTVGEDVIVLASGPAAHEAYTAALEEWRLLMAAALCGLSERALELAAVYANERIQFGRAIGTYQGISHPLADAVTAVDGGRWLVWDAVSSLAKGRNNAAALFSMAYAWATRSAAFATARAIHTFGGYGLALSSDVQLYFRRAKGWPLLAGDPRTAVIDVSDRLWRDAETVLPQSGETQIDFEFGGETEKFRQVVRDFFEATLDDELRAHADMSWDGYHPRFQKAAAEANLLFPTWPEEFGGQNRNAYDAVVLREEYMRAGWSVIPTGVTRLVSESVMRFGSEGLKREILPRVTRGEIVFCLGYTEPGSGSDVGAARTRATPDGNDWIINGQKMFNSGANLADYVFLLTRTGGDASKHRGLTMFLVPMNTPGIEVFPFDTISDERSNSTFFTDVRVSDRYRIGEVDGGWSVIRYALGLEHTTGYWQEQQAMVDRAASWACNTNRGNARAIDDIDVRHRLGLAAIRARVSWLLLQRGIWCHEEKQEIGSEGPMSKMFSSEAFLQDSESLMDLTAPDSLFLAGGKDSVDMSGFNFEYRHAIASTNYGGTCEIMRSLIGQLRLGLPRDR